MGSGGAEVYRDSEKDIAMDDPRQALMKLIEGLGESSRFVTAGDLATVIPGLEVTGLDSIGIPVSEADAKRLITKAQQAPYGRGKETIVDPRVRRVWQIEPTRFVTRNPDWNAQVDSIIEAIKNEFGIHETVSATLYKLLIYEKGGFFAPHRDSEKTSGMFATLVVCLPSRHQGGSLVVTHDGQERTIDFGGPDSEFKTRYAAFYADCQHEVTPVTAGYRVCLVYNLAITGKKRQPAAPQYAPTVEAAAGLLKELFALDSDNLNKIAIPLAHQYTAGGIDPRQLKGVDRARADVLARAARFLDYECYLALLTHYQSGEPNYSTLDNDHFRRPRSYREVDAVKDAKVQMAEVYQESRSIDHWLDPSGRKPAFGEISVQEKEILARDDKKGWSLKKEIHEATGNEGVSMELWYRLAVVVIWPRERYIRILAAEGQATALPALEELAARRKTAKSLAESRAFAKAIIDHWQPSRRRHDDAADTRRMLTLLEQLDDAELVKRFVAEVLPNDFDGSEGQSLRRLFDHHGWKAFETAVRGFLAKQEPQYEDWKLPAILAICEALCLDTTKSSPEARAVRGSLVEEMAGVLDRWDTPPIDASWHGYSEKRTGVIEKAVRLFAMFSTNEHMTRYLDRALAEPRRYNLHKALVPGVMEIARWVDGVPQALPAFSRLLNHCQAALRAATADPVKPPQDWTRNDNLACECEDCLALGRFLRDPAQRVARFPLRKDRRQHLHQEIDGNSLDCTHVTARLGSPQTLVVTKNQASYEKRNTQYDLDQARLAELDAIATKHAETAKPPAKRKISRK